MNDLAGFSFLAISAVLMGISNLCLKAAVGTARISGWSALILTLVRQPGFIIGMVLFALASLFYIRGLASLSLSTAYPVFVSIAVTVVAVGGMIVLGERITSVKLFGSVFVIAGIAMISRG